MDIEKGREHLLAAAKLGPEEGYKYLSDLFEGDYSLLPSVLAATKDYESDDGWGLKPETPPEIVELLTFLKRTLMGGAL